MSSLVLRVSSPYPALVGTASGLETVRLGSIANQWYPRHPRRAASIVAMLIFFICIIASKARFALPPPTVRLFLIVRRDLEGKGLTVLELRAAVETETGNAQNLELHRQHIALLAARVVTGHFVNSGHFTIGKGRRVEAGRILCILVEPEADRIFRLQSHGF